MYLTVPEISRGSLDSALARSRFATSPFPHAVIDGFFDDGTADALLTWLEADAPWILDTRSFYVQYDCSDLLDRLIGTPAEWVVSPSILELMRKHLERMFQKPFSSTRSNVYAHKLIPGHSIGIHNDKPTRGGATHRVIVNLNRQFDDSYGGHLVLFDRANPADTAVIIPPLHNLAVLLEFSGESWHSVDEVSEGNRYTLIYSFWTEEACRQVEREAAVMQADEYEWLIKGLSGLKADSIGHTRRSLLEHLTGTYSILADWGCDVETCKAGLFHSVLGTKGFRTALVPPDDESVVRRLIGDYALNLVKLFARLDSDGLVRIAKSQTTGAATANSWEASAVACIFWANTLEQLPHASVHSASELAQLRQVFHDTRQILPVRAQEEITTALSNAKESPGEGAKETVVHHNT